MTFDWREPDYQAALQERANRLFWIREAPEERLPPLYAYYRDHPADFINDWGMTFDPRNAERNLPTVVPFILFPKQREWVDWVEQRWRLQQPGITEKTRDMGMSWLAVAYACTKCLFNEGLSYGFGSRKEEYVDKLDSPKSLFYKARMFMRYLPPEFRLGWSLGRDAPHMRIIFPRTGSFIGGEAGDGIGRGDRAAVYFVDEAAHLERPMLIEAALSQTTNCRIDISSANGMANPFYQKRNSYPSARVFTFHWRDDPRKDEAWYDKQVLELDPVTVAQEIDINYAASVEGVIIDSAWVQAAVNACKKLGIEPTGARRGAMDVADEGRDKCAFASAKGVELDFIEEWSGKGSDIFGSVQRAFGYCDELEIADFLYDADGLGAGVRGDARVINEMRKAQRQKPIGTNPFRGSGGVFKPQAEDVKGRKNEDYFSNTKAQEWWALRRRFQTTYRAVTEGAPYKPDDIISLSLAIPSQVLNKLMGELSQPTWAKTITGKMLVDKMPDGALSPNLADTVMILFSRARAGMVISDEAVKATATR